MKITTKSGDGGESSLFGGKRLKKDSAYFEVLGDLDELHSFLGLAKFGIPEEKQHSYQTTIERVQDDIYRIMAIVGFEMKAPKNIKVIDDGDVAFLEREMEQFKEKSDDLNKFIRTGTSEAAARMHVARSVCRRAERSLVRIGGGGETLKYLNRLSDLLFIFGYSLESSAVKM